MRHPIRLIVLLAACLCAWPQVAAAWQTVDRESGDPAVTADDKQPDEHTSPQSFLDFIQAAGTVGYVIVLCSVAAVALAIEHLMTVRRSKIAPQDLADQVRQLVVQGQTPKAMQACQARPCPLAVVMHSGLLESDNGWPAAEKAMEDSLAEQSARMVRKIEYLSVIGNLAPMLGLLGTVIGMVMAFREVADTQGAARAADLAEGIYLALITTVMGLVVAIPALGAHAVFRNRVDQMVAETASAALHALSPLKQPRKTHEKPQPPKVDKFF